MNVLLQILEDGRLTDSARKNSRFQELYNNNDIKYRGKYNKSKKIIRI